MIFQRFIKEIENVKLCCELGFLQCVYYLNNNKFLSVKLNTINYYFFFFQNLFEVFNYLNNNKLVSVKLNKINYIFFKGKYFFFLLSVLIHFNIETK